MVTLYNGGDLVGKALPARVRVPRRLLPACVACQLLFVPIFLALLGRDGLPHPLQSDALPLAAALALGVCTG